MQHLMFLLQFLLKQTNKVIPGCVCRLPHVHSSCLPTTESPGGEGTSTASSSQRRARVIRASPPYQAAPAAPSALANTCFFIPGKERVQRPWKKLNQISTPQTTLPARRGCLFPRSGVRSLHPVLPRALLPRLTKPPAPERCWTPRTCFFLLPKCTSTLSKHPRF